MRRRDLLTAGAAAAGWLLMDGAPVAAGAAASLAERLGYRADDRLLILHADDVGMCHSVNAATIRAMEEGLVRTGSVMVPCPWFPEIAAWARERPDADLGIHLTLTSEWRHYRWRPVAPAERVKGLIDEEGFLWRSVEQVKAHASAAEVETEVRAQIARARAFGMRPTHVDSHMGTLFADPRYFEVYVRVSREVRLLPMLPGPTPEVLAIGRAAGVDYGALAQQLRDRGYLLLDDLNTGADGKTYEERKAQYHRLIRELKPGVTELILHLSGDDDEIRHVTAGWEARYNELRIFTDADTRALVAERGIKAIGYRPLADLWAKSLPAA